MAHGPSLCIVSLCLVVEVAVIFGRNVSWDLRYIILIHLMLRVVHDLDLTFNPL